MPKVLRILNRLVIGGPSINAVYLTKYMAPEYETLLVVGGKDDHEKDANHLLERLNLETYEIPEMRRSIHPTRDFKAYQSMKALIRSFKPDIVHTHAAKSGAIGRLAAYHCNVPVIVHTFHGHVFHSYFSHTVTKAFIKTEQYLAKISSGIIAISEQQKRELTEQYKICAPHKMSIIPLGLDLDLMDVNMEAKRQAFRAQYHIPDDVIAVGIIGRVVPIKNHALFLEVASKVIQINKKVVFVIIGDGDERPNMEQMCKQLQLDYAYQPTDSRFAEVIFTSWRTDVDCVLAGLDIVMLTSHNEGTPLSLIEAQAASKPVISTNVGGVKDVVLDKQTGFICEPGDVDGLTKAVVTLLGDARLRTSMGELGRHFAMERFSYQRLVVDMKTYYHDLLTKHTRS